MAGKHIDSWKDCGVGGCDGMRVSNAIAFETSGARSGTETAAETSGTRGGVVTAMAVVADKDSRCTGRQKMSRLDRLGCEV